MLKPPNCQIYLLIILYYNSFYLSTPVSIQCGKNDKLGIILYISDKGQFLGG